jgi:hypothetical protein
MFCLEPRAGSTLQALPRPKRAKTLDRRIGQAPAASAHTTSVPTKHGQSRRAHPRRVHAAARSHRNATTPQPSRPHRRCPGRPNNRSVHPGFPRDSRENPTARPMPWAYPPLYSIQRNQTRDRNSHTTRAQPHLPATQPANDTKPQDSASGSAGQRAVRRLDAQGGDCLVIAKCRHGITWTTDRALPLNR